MFRWLRPPAIDNELERVAFHSLHYSLLLVFVFAAFVAFPPKNAVQAIFNPISWGVILLCYVLLQKRRLRLAGTIFLVGSWLLVSINLVSINGINNPLVMFYVVVIIFADIIFARRRVVFLFTLFSILFCLVLVVGELRGVLPLQTTTLSAISVNRFIISAVILISTGILSSSASTILRRSLTRLQQNEADLQARNRELEALTRRLTASEERYRLLFENASVMAAVYDSDGQILLANNATALSAGKPRSELEGHNIHEAFTPELADVVAQMNQQVIADGNMITFEGSIILPDGKPIYYLRQAVPLPPSDSTADKPQVLVLTTDLTEQKRAIERQHELQAAQEKLSFFTDFFSTISHDFKTPLTVMETGLYLLERANDDASRREKIARLYKQVRLLKAYIQDMLMVSRLERIPALNLEPVDLLSLIRAILDSLAPQAEEKGIKCISDFPNEQVVIQANSDQIQRALTNLIENAIHYTPTGGQVCVTLARQTDSVMITVSDSGIGIHSEDIAHIFDSFFRAANAKAVVSTGSGLGLAIVKKIVELHGGSIAVTSQPQQGSRFIVTLPVPNPVEAEPV